MSAPDVSIHATFRSTDDGEVVLRQVALGYQSVVLIEPSVDKDGNVAFEIDATDIDRGELADVLRVLADDLAAEETTRADDRGFWCDHCNDWRDHTTQLHRGYA